MLEARRTSAWRSDYEISLDGRAFATYARSSWRGGGVLDVDGRPYQVRSNGWATTYTMVDEGGALVASAARVGRKDWTVDAAGVTHRFRRTSPWRMDHELVVQGLPMGSVRRLSVWKGDLVADLPGLSPLVAVFAVAVVITTWDLAAAAG
jgi:hypothetical protein